MTPQPQKTNWQLAAEAIAVQMRWFGVVAGVVLVEFGSHDSPAASITGLRVLLALGAAYAAVDTYFSLRGRPFLQDNPLVVSCLEAVFLGLLCHFHYGLGSPFRFYFMLSLLSCAIRYDRLSTYVTCLLHCSVYTLVSVIDNQSLFPPGEQLTYPITITVMLWVTWVGSSLASLLKQAQGDLERLNLALQDEQHLLEDRIVERTQELREAQASLLHQEKMAAFGLLAAGIAHEVGNPLASISSLVQMLNLKHHDEYTRAKLDLVQGQLTRIQNTLRELVDFSRPATNQLVTVNVNQVLEDAVGIAKYYQPAKFKAIETRFSDLPSITAIYDQLVQVFLNLILNAIDATEKSGRIRVTTGWDGDKITAEVWDNGKGIGPEEMARVFQPYYTAKTSGTGLGLFVSQKIVSEIGGQLKVSSSASGGTAFRVTLPLDRAAEPASDGMVAADRFAGPGEPNGNAGSVPTVAASKMAKTAGRRS